MRFLILFSLVAGLLWVGFVAPLYEGSRLERAPQNPAGSLAASSGVLTPAPKPRRPSVPAPRQLRLLTEGTYPPFNYLDRDGQLAGFDVAIAKALCARLDAECTLEARAWDTLRAELVHGRADAIVASMLIPRPETRRQDIQLIYTVPYYATPGRFAARIDSPIRKIDPDGLDGHSVIVQAGSTHQAFLRSRFPAVRIYPVATFAAALAALEKGEADLLFADSIALIIYLDGPRGTRSGQPAWSGRPCCRLLEPAFTDPEFFGEGAGIVFRTSDRFLRDEFNTALADIMADGTYADISARYLPAR